MNDFKNFLIAYFSAAPSLFAMAETRLLITLISAIVLPILFFTVGKTIDVALQIYLDRHRQNHDR
ncbi:MAG: hypothetical protein ACJ72Z_14405 [Pyrinomonadaceae bacterium]